MSCPTCDKTMHAMGCRVTDRNFYWCPTCGTTKTCDGDIAVPDLVRRCRVYSKALGNATGKNLAISWQALGIAESIRTPEERGMK